MKGLKKVVSLIIVCSMLLSTSAVFAQEAVMAGEEKAPKYVFYFIGDGVGTAQRQIAEYYLQETTGDKKVKLAMNTLPVAGINTTYSSDSLVPDSAAAGTALASGVKTNNGVIGKDADGEDVRTLLEAAEEKGYATGLVSTTRMTHATPAAFATHNISRGNENEIAVDYMDSGVDFLAGGGYRHFVPQYFTWGKSKRKDNENLLGQFYVDGYKVFVTENQVEKFRAYEPKAQDKVVALFTYSHLPYEVDRMQEDKTPSLAEITKKGIDVLSTYEDGFFMMVEGGRIDHACHANDIAGSIHDTLAFDRAIQEALAFYEDHKEETLIIVAGDHETGGMGLGFAKNYFLNIDAIEKAKVSVEDTLTGVYDGDHAKFITYVKENLGLTDLTAKELAELEAGMTLQDTLEKNPDAEYDLVRFGPSYYGPAAIAATHIVSERANIEWTTYAHSATAIPLTAKGVGAEKFGGYVDNTEVALALAELLDVTIGK